MKTDNKDGLDHQINDQLQNWSPLPSEQLFDKMQSMRGQKSKRKVWLFWWLIPIAATFSILLSVLFRFDPNTASTKDAAVLSTAPILTENPPSVQPEKQTYKNNGTAPITKYLNKNLPNNKTSHRPLKQAKQNKITNGITNNFPNPSSATQQQHATELVNNEPPAFKANTFTTSIVDTNKVDSLKAHICEEVIIPAHLLAQEKQLSKDAHKGNWWVAANYMQLLGKGIASNNHQSLFQPSQTSASEYAQASYGMEILVGKRLYKSIYVWSGMQYRKLIFTDVKSFEQNYKESIIANTDALYQFNQYFDLNYQILSMPLGIAWLKPFKNWQVGAQVATQYHYLLSTSSLQYFPLDESLKQNINAASDDRFNRHLIGAYGHVAAGRKVYKNLWGNVNIGASFFNRSFLNPTYYKPTPTQNLEIKLGLQYYF